MHTQGAFSVNSDGRCVLVFERRLHHPVEKVWRAITEVEHLSRWFADILDYDRSTLTFAEHGSELSFVPRAGFEQIDIQAGRVERVEAPWLLEYTWGPETLRWELQPDVEGGCQLTFTNVFDDRDFAPANAVGWHSGLDRLTDFLQGEDPAQIALEVDESAAAALLSQYEQSIRG